MISTDLRTSFSSRLRAKLQLLFPTAADHVPLDERKDYRVWFKDYLFTLHSIIRASVPLMEAGCEAVESGSDRLSIGLARYYNKHSKEEAQHDEWLLADLETMGVPRIEVLSRRPRVEVAELVGSQYYWIRHWHPVCLLGYIAVMEGYPPNRKAIKDMALRTGYPAEAFRTLAKHSYLDPGHRADLNRVLDALPLNQKQEEWITLNAIYTLGKWSEVMNNL